MVFGQVFKNNQISMNEFYYNRKLSDLFSRPMWIFLLMLTFYLEIQKENTIGRNMSRWKGTIKKYLK